jgi:three-Cys-motif partner protein
MIGDYWTKAKLERLDAYFPFFTESVGGRYQTVYTVYIDAFASTGRVKLRRPKGSVKFGFFPPPDPFIDGSARRALSVERPFDRYYFVDIERWKCERLERLRTAFPPLDKRIEIECGDANRFVRRFCRRMDTESSQALIFLDAPGTVVGWKTIETIARTGAVDLWYLFPLGIAVNRLLKRRGDRISEPGKKTLRYIFGTDEWEQEFYRPKRLQGFSPEPGATVKVADFKDITAFFLRRLSTVFPHVSKKTLALYNRRGNPMFILCFASADPNAGDRLAYAEAILSVPASAYPFLDRLQERITYQRR